MSDYSAQKGNIIREAAGFKQSSPSGSFDSLVPGELAGYDTNKGKAREFDPNKYKSQAISALGDGADPVALATYAANAARIDGFGGRAFPNAANDLKAAFGLNRNTKLIDDGTGDQNGVWSAQKTESFVNSFRAKRPNNQSMVDYSGGLLQ